MTNYTCIGIGTTDENGIAHITHDCEGNPLSEPGYHGSGAGETLIIASLDKPVSVESILSNILNITDEDRYKLTLTGDKSIIQTGEVATLSATLTNNNIAVVNKTVNFLKKEEVFRDGGITGDSSAEYWAWNSSYVSQSVGSTGTTVTNSDTSDRVYTLRKATSGTQYEVFSRFCSFEFDLISVTGNVQIQQRIGTTQKAYNLTETGHYKIINDDEYINIYCNDVLKDRLENTMTGLHQIRFGLFGVGNFTYKNFKVLDDEIFDTATTDVNGVATVYYTGEHAGQLYIRAECMNLQETCSILDAIFVDYGIEGNKNNNWQNYSNRLGITTNAEGTLITGYASANGYYFANGNDKFIFSDYICEFDVVTSEGNVRWYHQNEDTSNENVFTIANYISSDIINHFKLICKDNSLQLYVNNTLKRTVNLTVDSPYEVGFRFNTGTSNNLKYKDLIIYSG